MKEEENIIFQVASISLVILIIGVIWKPLNKLLNSSSPSITKNNELHIL
jgi:flagellar biogenesis protein FliO